MIRSSQIAAPIISKHYGEGWQPGYGRRFVLKPGSTKGGVVAELRKALTEYVHHDGARFHPDVIEEWCNEPTRRQHVKPKGPSGQSHQHMRRTPRTIEPVSDNIAASAKMAIGGALAAMQQRATNLMHTMRSGRGS